MNPDDVRNIVAIFLAMCGAILAIVVLMLVFFGKTGPVPRKAWEADDDFDWHKIARAYMKHVYETDGSYYGRWGGIGGTAIETELAAEEREALFRIQDQLEAEEKAELEARRKNK